MSVAPAYSAEISRVWIFIKRIPFLKAVCDFIIQYINSLVNVLCVFLRSYFAVSVKKKGEKKGKPLDFFIGKRYNIRCVIIAEIGDKQDV